MTILAVIQRSADFLAKKGVDSPRLQVELLLAHVLKMPRMKLYLNFERELSAAEMDALRELVRRRGQREPLQHIIGSVSFCGLELAVNRHVLVPRPETELLAERAWNFLRGISRRSRRRARWTSAPAAAAWPSPWPSMHRGRESMPWIFPSDALNTARQNAARHQVAERIHFHAGDGFAALAHRTAFDLIVSNPPYIASAEIETLEPEVRDFEPRLALDGGADGLDFYRRIAAEAARFLQPGGRIMLELNDYGAAARSAKFLSDKGGWSRPLSPTTISTRGF